jgi:hypothetical protein
VLAPRAVDHGFGPGRIKPKTIKLAFAALKADGSITTWGSLNNGGTNASNVPTDKGYTKIYSTVRKSC